MPCRLSAEADHCGSGRYPWQDPQAGRGVGGDGRAKVAAHKLALEPGSRASYWREEENLNLAVHPCTVSMIQGDN